jgi:hypothetical protein
MNAFVTVTTPMPTPPTTLISGDGRNGNWTNHDVNASLFALQADGGAPVDRTYYGVDDAGCNERTHDCAIYDGVSFMVTGEGTHDVTYFSSDVAGGSEVANHTTVRIDKTAPETAASVATAGGGTQLTLDSTDALSGVAETDYAVDGGDFKPYGDPVTISKPGDHTVRFRASDRAGNYETPKSVSIHVDPPPTCTATASHSRILIADGRLVATHITVRNAAGTTIALHGVARSAHGVAKDWQVGTADVDGRVAAVPGVNYAFRYTVTDAAGRTGSCVARVTVSP